MLSLNWIDRSTLASDCRDVFSNHFGDHRSCEIFQKNLINYENYENLIIHILFYR